MSFWLGVEGSGVRWGGSERKTRKVWQDPPPPATSRGPLRVLCQAPEEHNFLVWQILWPPMDVDPNCPQLPTKDLCPLGYLMQLTDRGALPQPLAANGDCALPPQGHWDSKEMTGPFQRCPSQPPDPNEPLHQPDLLSSRSPLCPQGEGALACSSGMRTCEGGEQHLFLADLQPGSPSNEEQSEGRGPRAGEHLDCPTSRMAYLLLYYRKCSHRIQSLKSKTKGTQ